MISREEATAFLRNQQLNVDQVQTKIDNKLLQLSEVSQHELMDFLLDARHEIEVWHNEQLKEWESFMQGAENNMTDSKTPLSNGCQQASQEEGMVFGAQLRSLEKRIAAIGGRPALGQVVLPRMTPGARTSLQATASPAAVEILRSKLGSEADAAKPLNKIRDDSSGAARTPVVQLRSVSTLINAEKTPGPLSGPSTVGQAPPNSELAKVLQRRAERQGTTIDS